MEARFTSFFRASRMLSILAISSLFAIAPATIDCSSPAPAEDDSGDDDDGTGTDAAVHDAGKDSGKKDAAVKDTGVKPIDANPDAPDPWEDPARPGWTLVWHDEFTGASGDPVDSTKWNFDIGAGGWGNAEAEYYTDRPQNSHLDGNGNLSIRAFNEAYKGSTFTSARIQTQTTFTQLHGRFEVRARMPIGRGIWPAFWMLGTNNTSVGWPDCGEIDVFEFIGSEINQIRGTLHGPGYSGPTALVKQYQLPAGNTFADTLHVFAVEWEEGTMRFFVDDELYATQSPAALPSGTNWVFDDHPFFIILNLAVGGILPGSPDDSTQFPSELIVDYVRVYKR